MSQENVEVVRGVFDDWTLGKLNEAEIRSAYHPDVEFLPLRAVTEGAYRGIAGIERFIADTEDIFYKFEFHYDLLDLDERVLAWGKIHFRARGSGIETDVSMGGVFELVRRLQPPPGLNIAAFFRVEDAAASDPTLWEPELTAFHPDLESAVIRPQRLRGVSRYRGTHRIVARLDGALGDISNRDR